MRLEGRKDFLKNVEFLMMGRAPYRLNNILRDFFNRYPVRDIFLMKNVLLPFLPHFIIILIIIEILFLDFVVVFHWGL